MVSIIDFSKRLEALAVEKNMAAILASMDDGVVSEDLQGRITAWNRAAERIFQRKKDEAIGQPSSILVPVDGREMAFIHLQKVLDGQEVHDVELLLQRADGSTFDASVTMSLLVDETQKISGVTTTIRDISRRKKLERELERAQKELMRSHQSLEKKVEERTEELERFVYTVSHDLKSPLVTISGYLKMVERDMHRGKHERMEEDLKRIGKAANQMKNLLDDILELSRIGRVENKEEKISVSELAAEVMEQLAGIITEHGARVDVEEGMPVVLGDRFRLAEVYQNLIENALKYSRNGHSPQVKIGVRLERDGAVFFVKDNGIGIQRRHFSKIFGLFDRLNPSIPGTGVGLAIVRRVIEIHGGRIWVESEGEGKGSEFCFTLPVVRTSH